MYFETHAHFDDERYSEDREQVIEEARRTGVDIIVNCGSTIRTSRASVDLAAKHDFVYASVGVHPHDAKSLNPENLLILKKLAKSPKVVAIGEIGLDFFYDHSERHTQKLWFEKQLEFAIDIDLPVIHS